MTPRVLAPGLADGSVFEGELFGATAAASGEVVFNTALSGYQEILTDPSYAGQIITFTNPHIGNYGVNATDFEARRLFCRGRRRPRAVAPAEQPPVAGRSRRHARRYGIPGITGIDTRRLTRLIRDTGAIPGRVRARPTTSTPLRAAAAAEPGTDGIDLVATVTTPEPYTVGGDGRYTDRRLRLRHQAHDPAPPRRARHGRGRPGDDAGRRRARPRPRRHLPVQRARRPGRGRRTPSRRSASCSATASRCSASASATSCSAGRSAPRRSSCRSGTTAPTTRSRTSRPGSIEITSQNHNFAVDASTSPAGSPS